MKKIIVTVVLSAMLVSGILYAQDKAGDNPTTQPAEQAAQPSKEEFMKDVSYCIGMDIANAIKSQDLGLDSKELVAGLEAVFGDAETRIAQEDAQKIMMQFNVMMRQKMQAKVDDANKQFSDDFKKKEGVKAAENGILYRVISSGDGNTPTGSDTVSVNYKGTLVNGQEFDSSYKRGEPVTFPVDGVIPGWTQVLQMMKEGDKWEVMIPSELAYGERGIPNVIPPDSILVFEIELLKVEPAAAATTQPAEEAAE